MRIDALSLGPPTHHDAAQGEAGERETSTPFAAVLREKNDPANAAPPVPSHPDAISESFKAEVARMAGRLGMNPAHLIAVMSFESGLNPAAKNATTHAVGLIQFMPDVAADVLDLPRPPLPATPSRALDGAALRDHLEALKAHRQACREREHQAVTRMGAMTREEQLPYVEKYFAMVNHGRPTPALIDTYMGMFWPRAIGQGPDYVVARRDAQGFERLVYAQNAALDADRDGRITAGEAAGLVAGAAQAPKVRALAADVERYAEGAMKQASVLRYDEALGDRAPVVLASGQGELAEQIERAARAYGVPLVRDRPLVQALSELHEGDEIPEALYQAVAEILRELG